MRILVAPQEFKGSLTAHEAASSITRGISAALPDAEITQLPLADGGPGTVDVLVHATNGAVRQAPAHDPLGRPISAHWGVLGDGRTAVIEMAAASGLVLLREDELDPTRTTTMGTGELLLAAFDAGFRRIIVGMGGSATNDGGAGLAQALGVRLLKDNRQDLPPGGAALSSLHEIDVSRLDPRVANTEVLAATDVQNPLCGEEGASIIYGPQKGASAAVARQLDAALGHYAEVIEQQLEIGFADVPGAGAAGGLGAGLIAFCGASIEAGFDIVAEAVRLHKAIERADIVITGEGRLDRQSSFGKTTAGVSRLARAARTPVVALAGAIDQDAQNMFDAAFALSPDLAPPADAQTRAEELLSTLAETKLSDWISARSTS